MRGIYRFLRSTVIGGLVFLALEHLHGAETNSDYVPLRVLSPWVRSTPFRLSVGIRV
jgi:hypothetical protein